MALSPNAAYVQKRCYVRVPTDLPIRVSMRGADGTYTLPHMTQMLNVSGGGIGFEFEEELPVGTEAHVIFMAFPEMGLWETDVIIRRCVQVLEPPDPLYHIGAEFSKPLTPREKNLLSRGIFILQRESVQKGLKF